MAFQENLFPANRKRFKSCPNVLKILLFLHRPVYIIKFIFHVSVGKNISTKVPDGKPYGGEASIWRGYGEKYRLDITHEYKYPGGTYFI